MKNKNGVNKSNNSWNGETTKHKKILIAVHNKSVDYNIDKLFVIFVIKLQFTSKVKRNLSTYNDFILK